MPEELTDEMTLSTAIKTLKVIKKRMRKNTEKISLYSSQPEKERPKLGTESVQRDEIQSLIQSNQDLANRFMALYTR